MDKKSKRLPRTEQQKEDPQHMLPKAGGRRNEGTTGAGSISGPQGYIGDHD